MDKKEYVKKYLEPAITSIQVDIKALDYKRVEKTGLKGKYYDEVVIITYDDGWKREVNVNMDSCLGIVHDVLKYIY